MTGSAIQISYPHEIYSKQRTHGIQHLFLIEVTSSSQFAVHAPAVLPDNANQIFPSVILEATT